MVELTHRLSSYIAKDILYPDLNFVRRSNMKFSFYFQFAACWDYASSENLTNSLNNVVERKLNIASVVGCPSSGGTVSCLSDYQCSV